MTETEIKSMIDKDLYESILNAFTWEKVREQTNYYYTDKAGILREKRIMVRIRVVGEDTGETSQKRKQSFADLRRK